jgi:Arc/MetJ family transcription regulator
MRITVDIDDSELDQIQKITGQKKKSPAVSQALSAFLRQHARDRFVERALAGGTDYALTNDELERRDWYEAR